MTVFIVGDSHVATLKIAYAQDVAHFRAIVPADLQFLMFGAATALYEPFFIDDGDRIRITIDGVMERADRFQDGTGSLTFPEGAVFIVSAGLHTSSILLGRTWAQHALWRTKAASNRSAMSDAVFRAIVLHTHQHVLAFIAAVRRRAQSVHVLSAPPPSERFALFGLGYDREDVLIMDDAVRSIMRAEIARLGVDVIEPPDGGAANGLLRSEFLMEDSKDRHHGNADYSKMALEKTLANILAATR